MRHGLATLFLGVSLALAYQEFLPTDTNVAHWKGSTEKGASTSSQCVGMMVPPTTTITIDRPKGDEQLEHDNFLKKQHMIKHVEIRRREQCVIKE